MNLDDIILENYGALAGAIYKRAVEEARPPKPRAKKGKGRKLSKPEYHAALAKGKKELSKHVIRDEKGRIVRKKGEVSDAKSKAMGTIHQKALNIYRGSKKKIAWKTALKKAWSSIGEKTLKEAGLVKKPKFDLTEAEQKSVGIRYGKIYRERGKKGKAAKAYAMRQAWKDLKADR